MKRVLFIEGWFPPTGGMAGLRSLKFCKYLPENNWEPIVLTIKDPCIFYSKDPSLLGQASTNLTIYPTYSFQPVKIYRNLINFFENLGILNKEIHKITTLPRISSKGILGGFKKFFSKYLLIPDDYVGWLPFAFIRGLIIIKQKKIDVIFSTRGTRTAHLVGLLLKVATGKPWVVDFRDLWIAGKEHVLSPYSLMVEGFMEKKVIGYADRIVAVTSYIANTLKEKYAFLPENILTITNGFDSDDYKVNLVGRQNADKFTLTHTGTIYSPGSIRSFFVALKGLPSTVKESIRVNIIGGMYEEDNNLITKMDLEKIIYTLPYIPRREVIKYQLVSDVLLLHVAPLKGNQWMPTGKIYEYIGTRKPILALVPPEGIAANLIKEMGAGFIVHPEDVEEMRSQLLILYEKWKRGLLSLNLIPQNLIKRFEYRQLTKQLSDVFDELL